MPALHIMHECMCSIGNGVAALAYACQFNQATTWPADWPLYFVLSLFRVHRPDTYCHTVWSIDRRSICFDFSFFFLLSSRSPATATNPVPGIFSFIVYIPSVVVLLLLGSRSMCGTFGGWSMSFKFWSGSNGRYILPARIWIHLLYTKAGLNVTS